MKSRWISAAAITAGVLFFLSNLFSEFLLPGEKDGEIVRLGLGLVYIAAYGVGAVALVLALRGLSGLHRGRGELTRAGHNGMRVAVAGAALHALFAAAYFATAAATGDAVDAAFFLYALGFLLLIGGSLTAGVSMIRTGVQRPVGTLLLVAGAMAIVTIVTPAPVHDVGFFLFDAAWIGIGLAVTRHSSPVSMKRVATMASIVALAAMLVPAAGAKGTGPPTDVRCGDTITGIVLEAANGNQVKKNLVSGNDLFGMILSGSDANHVVENVAAGNGIAGILLEASGKNRIEKNTVSLSGDAGIAVVGGSAENALVKNAASSNATDGILADSTSHGTLVERNLADGNGDDGIDLDSPVSTVGGNRADENGDLGIEAEPGVTDAGGNRASGQRQPSPMHKRRVQVGVTR